MCSTDPLTLATWITLLQEANRATDQWKDDCSYWKHKYHLLHQEYMHILKSRLCESCRAVEDGELCSHCSQRWTRCT